VLALAVLAGPFVNMAKSNPQPDVLVLGQHPCAYLAACIMLEKPGVTVAHATIPGDTPPDRLVIINPQLFALHKPLEKIKKKLELTPVYGAMFLSEDPATRGEWCSKAVVAYIGCYSDIRKQLAALAKEAGAKCHAPKSLNVTHVHERGFEVSVDSHHVQPKAVLLAGNVSPEQGKMLGLPDDFHRDVMRRYSFVRLRGVEKWTAALINGGKPTLPMSLDLSGKLTWAWMLPGVDEIQLAVEQPLDDIERNPPQKLIEKWVGILRKHGCMKADGPTVKTDSMESIDFPAAGALAREIIANRTLLFGPAGGFYTASLEDLYPNCWSAVFAVEAVREAIKEPHLQDALQPYRQKWGTTLGEYLRGPQQNLRFLLPLVYRNPTMTRLMAESILLGKPVVR
jgi:flavin-dependent dehydrogenase